MGFKKLFRKNDKAVSPVIGVILMVAITVILAAAIGSSVFNQNPVQSSSKADINVKAVPLGTNDNVAYITIEHLAGDTLDFEHSKAKISATNESGNSIAVYSTGIGAFSAGDVKKVALATTDTPTSSAISVDSIRGKTVNIKITDTTTNQVVCDRDVKF